MRGVDRKMAARIYKEREAEAGVFVVRCAVDGRGWVGVASDLPAVRNRLWFTLALGSAPHEALQRAWTAQGAERFSFEVVERIKEKDVMLRASALRAAASCWAARLGASRL